MDTAYNTYGNNAMGIGLGDAGLNNTIQMAGQSANNVIQMADRIGIEMVDRNVEKSFGGNTRSSAIKKAKFTPSSKYNIEFKYSNFVKSSRQNSATKMPDNVVNIDDYRKPIATENNLDGPSLTCQRLNEKINSKTNQLEDEVRLSTNVIDMNKHIFAGSCKPIKMNGRSITNSELNRKNLEKYYGKPVESHIDRNTGIDVSSIDNQEVTESVNDAFKIPTMPLNDTFQVSPMELNSKIVETADTIVDSSSDVLSDMEMKQSIELPDKKMDVTSEYNVDALFKDTNNTDFQLPSIDSLKKDSISVGLDTSYNEESGMRKTNNSDIESAKENIRAYISNTNSREGLEKFRAVLDDALKTSHNLANVIGTTETELVDTEKQHEQLNKETEQYFEKLMENYEEIKERNKKMQQKYEQLEETLSMRRQDIEEGLKRREEVLGLLDMVGGNIQNNPSTNQGRRGKSA